MKELRVKCLNKCNNGMFDAANYSISADDYIGCNNKTYSEGI